VASDDIMLARDVSADSRVRVLDLACWLRVAFFALDLDHAILDWAAPIGDSKRLWTPFRICRR
jgi:hypothetical protein